MRYDVKCMSVTFTVRIPRKLKKNMEKYPADWDQEVRNFLEERVKQIEIAKALKEIEPRAEKRKTKTDLVILIREYRESQSNQSEFG